MPTIFIAGDSTAARKGGGEWPMAGWGEFLAQHVAPGVHVENRAINGRSTRSFLAEGRLADIEQDFHSGDLLLIQFGHNDQKIEDPLRYTDPQTEYRHNLRSFIDSARNLGGYPVLLTSVSRRRFTPEGEPDPEAVGLYPQAAREVAGATGTPLLDIFAASQQLFRRLGAGDSAQLFMHLPPGSRPNYPDGVTDDTHFSQFGAQQIAALVAEALKQTGTWQELFPGNTI
ncbi:rhamnogalacturonan acetylesterase [Paenibacillus sp. MMS20-IR301]|uniref:rhamnogalacturonan acetylesterase n=1 Tax=Paenibacillus sp. MMS20-IR301 TaxID=2895946 RepID=UPI0028EB1534|nr:rhamnogalacturonan acetylesterase [Paenibacillus sp. MMS20-IR301]WNS44247.1 rhamnogalacturonan acetylesterase [Paenibacillus sp. MMS20-IR301]